MLSKQANRLINARNWAVLVKPEQIVRDNDPADSVYGKFVCEPLERGYGTTIGNALRRVLLASLQGAAFVAVKISGVQHEFTTIPGVLEDVTDIILNIKQVRLAMDTDAPQTVVLDVRQKGEVTAGDIQGNQHVEVLNPELHIATLTEDVEFHLELEVRMGKGYVPADMHEGLSEEIGLIKLYQVTGEQKYLEQAKYFIDARGVGENYFLKEMENKSREGKNHKGRIYYEKILLHNSRICHQPDFVGLWRRH